MKVYNPPLQNKDHVPSAPPRLCERPLGLVMPPLRNHDVGHTNYDRAKRSVLNGPGWCTQNGQTAVDRCTLLVLNDNHRSYIAEEA